MEETDKTKLRKIVQDRREAHQFYSEKSSVYRAFVDMEKATYEAGALDSRTKELIAVGISIVGNCESCMEWHIKKALEQGASEEQVIEAIGVGIEMSGGPGTVAARFAYKVLKACREDR